MRNIHYIKTGVLLGVVSLMGACGNPKQEEVSTPTLLGFDKSLMDTTANPCDDFYRYAAGGWMDANPIPGTESRWSMFNVLSKQNDERIREILEEKLDKTPAKGSPEQLVRDMYVSAMDTLAIESLGVAAIQSELDKIDAFKSKEELFNSLGNFKKNGAVNLFSFYVSIDAKNSEYNAVYFGQGGLGLPDRDYYLKEDAESENIRKEYKLYINKLLGLANHQDAEKSAESIMTLETKLAVNSMSRVEQRDPEKTYNKMSWNDFKKAYSYFDWDSFLSSIGGSSAEEVIVSQPEFYAKLALLVKEHTLNEWKSYAKWHLLNNFSGYLSKDFEKANFDFYQTTLRGTSEMKPRWEKGVNIVNGNLGEPLGQLFVKKYFSEESKKRVGEMVEELRTAFGERIQKLEWMSAETKAKAMEKLDAFGYKIGYTEKWKDYSMVDIQPNNLIQNVLNVKARNLEIMLEKIGQPVDKTEWGMTPQTVNAYYSPTRNEIVFPAGILQPPFYDPNVDDAINYGGIGAVIGHEFSHGFDDKGSKYDGKGNLSNWWTDTDIELFKQRTNSIVEQFNNFEVLDGVFIKGDLTQGENIADLAGLTMAYYALKNAKAKQKEETKSPDGFTWQQRFFLGWGLVWAQNITEKELRQRIITDPHSPGRYRVVGPLSNMPEFQEAFGCKTGDKMKAEESKRVIIW